MSSRPVCAKIVLAFTALCLTLGGGISAVCADEPYAWHDPQVGPPNGVDKVVRSKLPYWRVGDIDKSLSRLCSLGQFNQRVPFKYSGIFTGPKGSSLVGGVKGTGLNLYDPRGKADHGHDYWFYRDRTSDCIVFKAKVKPNTDPNAPPTPPNAATTVAAR